MRGSSWMRYLRTAGALAAAAALAVPVAASAHPSVYTGEATVADGPDAGSDPDTQERHTVINHNNTFLLRETNGQGAPRGVVSYALLPGFLNLGDDPAQQLATGGTGAQAHHTCDVDPLNDTDAIRAWQGAVGADPEDPFYNYIPFQKVRAGEQDLRLSREVRGLDDTPSDWIDDVRTLTNGAVDLATVSDDPAQAIVELEAMCEGLPGANNNSFVPADEIQTSARSLQLEMIRPLETQITSLQSSLTAAQQALAAAQASATAANARLAQVMPELTPLSVALSTARFTARNVARRGATATVTGPPLQPVNVRLVIAKSAAKKLRLGSRVLASRRVTTNASGSAQATLKPNRRVARALRRLRRAAAMTVDAASADRATARGTLTRR
jgi:hypothetical protein